MLRSLHLRLLLSHLLVGGLVLLLLGVSFLVLVSGERTADRLVFERLDTIARVATAQERLRASTDDVPIQRLLPILGRVIGAQALLVNERGQPTLDPASGTPLPPLATVVEALEAPEQAAAFTADDGSRWLVVARELGPRRTLVVLAPRPTIRTLALILQDTVGPLWQAGLVALLASVVLAALLARWIAAPLQRAAAAAGRVAAGDYEQRLDPAGPEETRRLAGAFNQMVQQVRLSRQAQRDFVANVSHELKTPLTSIQGFGQAIADGTARGGESLERAGQVIVQEAARLGRLVDDLLALTRFDAGQAMIDRRLIDPATVLAAAHERMQIAAAEQGVELSLTAKPLPPLPADPDRLLQVMTNLIVNAIQHTARGGRILVAGQADAEWLRLTVEDNGPGIAPEHLPRIFERFYRADPARPAAAGRGSGLGLAIAEEIVRAHGGRVDVWSQPGVGSRFTVVLPLAPEAASTISARRR